MVTRQHIVLTVVCLWSSGAAFAQERASSASVHSHLQLTDGYDFVRFRSAPFNADLSALRTTLIWSQNNWIGLEGSTLVGFGDSTLNRWDSKLFLYTAGARLAQPSGKWRPWAHGLIGGIHMYPQTAFGLNAMAFQVGGGVDRPVSPSFSLRFESEYLRTRLYSSAQNGLILGAGIVIHFWRNR